MCSHEKYIQAFLELTFSTYSFQITTPNRSSNMTIMNSIPNDLILDIFSRMSINTIARCRCVSKQWWYMLHHQDFTELFLTRSSARPRLLFFMRRLYEDDLVFFWLPQPQHPYEKVSSPEFHMKLDMDLDRFGGHASGLFSFSRTPSMFSEENEDTVHVICNPSTWQCRRLPKLKNVKVLQSLLGFDPIDKQIKILQMAKAGEHRIMTLGTGKMRWRKIQCPLAHNATMLNQQICINGVLYYLTGNYNTSDIVIVCFDVRSEEFKLIDNAESFLCYPFTTLVNYKGKLGVINWIYNDITFELFVLENVEKQEFSKYVYTLPKNKIGGWDYISIVGVTASGEFVFSSDHTSGFMVPFYVLYFNPHTNTLQTIEIRGLGEYSEEGIVPYYDKVFGFVDYIEDLRFDLEYAATSSKAHIQQDRHTFESSNKFDALCLIDDDEFTGVKT